MRRSTIIAVSILALACVGLLVAAQMLLQPFHEDASLAGELTRLLTQEQALAEGSTVRLLGGLPASPRTLAEEGRGVVVTLEPAAALRGRRGGLEGLVRRVTEVVLERYRDRRTDWIEFELKLGGAEAEPFRTVVAVGSGGLLVPPAPPLPAPAR